VDLPAGSDALQAYLSALRAQIVRDAKVLREDPIYHAPSAAFYVARIAAFKAVLAELEAR
jgi:hypothetical protein